MEIDPKFKVSVLILDFDGCSTKFVRLWPYNSVQKNQFLNLDRTPFPSPSPSENSGYESDRDTVFYFFEEKMNFISSNLMHPREKLPQLAVIVLDTNRDVNFQCGRFFITWQDVDSHVKFTAFRLWKIEIFYKFIKNNIDTVINKGFICEDVKVFSNILETAFIDMVPVDPKGNFKKVCSNFPFEFLIMFDLFREHPR